MRPDPEPGKILQMPTKTAFATIGMMDTAMRTRTMTVSATMQEAGSAMRIPAETELVTMRPAGPGRGTDSVADTEDIFQTVFLKYALSSVRFENEEHEKAWFLRVTINACKDLLKSFFRSRTVPLDEIMEVPSAISPDYREVLEAVLALPAKYKDVVYLHYYEGYTAPQISQILGKNTNTVYTLLNRSRQLLREKLGGEEDG